MVTSEVRWKYVVRDDDRHGNVRLYYRRKGFRKIRLPGLIGSDEFKEAYDKAARSIEAVPRAKRRPSTPQSFRWLCEQYFASTTYRTLDQQTRKARRSILEMVYDEPMFADKPGDDKFAECPIAAITAQHVKVLHDRRFDRREAANNRLKAMRALFKFAGSQQPPLMLTNPARDIMPFKSEGEGHHTWTMAEIERYVTRHPFGTKAYKALCLFLFTGQRISDVAVLGRQHEVRGRELHFIQAKNKARRPVKVEIPILSPLRAAIDAHPSAGLHYLETEFGNPFTVKGLANWLKRRCREAGLPEECTAHGLRKAGATIAAENGASDSHMMSIFGWADHRQPANYTRKAQRRKMAAAGMHFLIPREEDEDGVFTDIFATGPGAVADPLEEQPENVAGLHRNSDGVSPENDK